MKPILFQPTVHRDSRGLFFESHHTRMGLPEFIQDNISVSKKGVVRGFHYQVAPYAQGKLIRCVRGGIFDVAVNLETGVIYTQVLDDSEHNSLYIPPGFAHGFQALTEGATIHYKCTQVYSKTHERGFNPLSKNLDKFSWPLPVTEISQKDLDLPVFP